MYLLPGVDISKMCRPCRRTFNKVDAIFTRYTEHFVISATYGGVHQPSSLHYANKAYDFLHPAHHLAEICLDLKQELGDNFDVVCEKDCIHVEYDPKYGGRRCQTKTSKG
jgi:hypothetical protein